MLHFTSEKIQHTGSNHTTGISSRFAYILFQKDWKKPRQFHKGSIQYTSLLRTRSVALGKLLTPNLSCNVGSILQPPYAVNKDSIKINTREALCTFKKSYEILSRQVCLECHCTVLVTNSKDFVELEKEQRREQRMKELQHLHYEGRWKHLGLFLCSERQLRVHVFAHAAERSAGRYFSQTAPS